MTTLRRVLVSPLAIAMSALILLASCGGLASIQKPSQSTNSAPSVDAAAAPALPGAPSGVVANSAGAVGGAAKSISAPAAAQAPSGGASGVNLPTSLPNQVLIKNATIQIEAKDPTAGLDRLSQVAQDVQGQLTNSHYAYQGDRLFITQTILVPVDRFPSAMSQIRGLAKDLGKELSENVATQDVTDEYVDVQAQLDNLRITQQRLQQFMDKATDVNQALAVQRELTNVQGQMDRLQGRAKYLSTKSAMSTIDVTLQMPPVVSPPTSLTTGWQPADTALQALGATLHFWQGVFTFFIWSIVFIVPLAPFLVIAWLLWRRFHPRGGAPLAPATPSVPTP